VNPTNRYLCVATATGLLLATGAEQTLGAGSVAPQSCSFTLRFVGEQDLSPQLRVDGSVVGGLSGLDFDPAKQLWYFISDDRAEHGPSRFLTGELIYDSSGFHSAKITSARALGSGDPEILDSESIRLSRTPGQLLIAGESDTGRHTGPWIRRADTDGHWLGPITLPDSLAGKDTAATRGPRINRSLEGIAYSAGGRSLWLSMESPLVQDGPEADAMHGADVRITRLRLADGPFSQYVYPVDAARPASEGQSSDNGISEVLASGANALLVLERSGSLQADGHFQFHTRLYCADSSAASDVAKLDSLAGRTYTRMTKRLLLDFDSLHDAGAIADNLEGMAFGPDLESGRSLVFVSDNNFFPDVPTQLLLFELRAPQKRARTDKVVVRGAPMK